MSKNKILVTVSTSNSSGKHPTTRVFYRPVASGSGGVSPDLLKDTPRIKIALLNIVASLLGNVIE